MLMGWGQPPLRRAQRPQEGLVPSAARAALAPGPLRDHTLAE